MRQVLVNLKNDLEKHDWDLTRYANDLVAQYDNMIKEIAQIHEKTYRKFHAKLCDYEKEIIRYVKVEDFTEWDKQDLTQIRQAKKVVENQLAKLIK